jgi:hypothetical protein
VWEEQEEEVEEKEEEEEEEEEEEKEKDMSSIPCNITYEFKKTFPPKVAFPAITVFSVYTCTQQ